MCRSWHLCGATRLWKENLALALVKKGNSTSTGCDETAVSRHTRCAGEQWDVSEQMDTYYNPIPHFDYRLALNHSPTLRKLPVLPRGGNELGTGIDDL